VTKPQGYMQAAEEQLFCLLVLCLPYWQTLLFAGISGMVSFLVLTFLLLFVVARSRAICRAITARLKALPASWVAPIPKSQRPLGWGAFARFSSGAKSGSFLPASPSPLFLIPANCKRMATFRRHAHQSLPAFLRAIVPDGKSALCLKLIILVFRPRILAVMATCAHY